MTIRGMTDLYLARFLNIGFVTQANWSILSSDPTLLFINSTMVSNKEFMQRCALIKSTAIVQSCFRNNGNANSLSNFTMIGVSAMYKKLYLAGKTLMHFLYFDVGLDYDCLHCVIHRDDADLIDFWLKVGNSKTLHLTDEKNEQYSTRWKYGDGFNFFGRGITLVYLQNGNSCSNDCGIFCHCRRHLQFGNIIIIEHNKIKYLDFGFGLERLLSCKYNNDIFLLPEIAASISKLPSCILSLETTIQNKIYDLIRSVLSLYNCGIRVGNNKEAYILKKLIRTLTDTIVEACELHLYIKDIFVIIEKSIHAIASTDKCETDVVYYVQQQVKEYVKNLVCNIKSAAKWLRKNGDVSQDKKLIILRDRYGISSIIAKQIYNGY